MRNEAADDALQTLIQRVDVFEKLVAKPGTLADLDRRLDKSRSTVYRALNDLQRYGFVVDNDEYEPTACGILFHRAYRRFHGVAETLLKQHELFESRRMLSRTVPTVALADATVRSMADCVPAELYSHLAEHVTDASTLAGVIPTIYPEMVAEMIAQVRDGSLHAEVVFTESAVGHLDDSSRVELSGFDDLDGFNGYRVDVGVPFGVVVVGDGSEVVIVVEDTFGTVQGVIETSNPTAVAWATGFVDQHRCAGSRLG